MMKNHYLLGIKIGKAYIRNYSKKVGAANCSEEILEITDVMHLKPKVYWIKDLAEEEIAGAFHRG